MFVVYSGRVGVYLNDDEKVGVKHSKDVVGDTALDTYMNRNAGVKAEEVTVIFKIRKADYENVILGIKKLEKHENTKFLMNIRYFQN